MLICQGSGSVAITETGRQEQNPDVGNMIRTLGTEFERRELALDV
jgi:hypothetical protein